MMEGNVHYAANILTQSSDVLEKNGVGHDRSFRTFSETLVAKFAKEHGTDHARHLVERLAAQLEMAMDNY